MICVAGSGGSAVGAPPADVTTKKWPTQGRHIVYTRAEWRLPKHPDNFTVWANYRRRPHWEALYRKFYLKEGFGVAKMSNGLQAICVALDLFEPNELGLIGFDSFLDQSKKNHCWKAERAFAKSLVTIVDLREATATP